MIMISTINQLEFKITCLFMMHDVRNGAMKACC